METVVDNEVASFRGTRFYAAFESLLNGQQQVLALAMRLYLANVFALSGWLKLTRWDSTLALFENEYQVPLLSPYAAAVLGTTAELTLPVLFALGIGSRATALALFMFNAVAVISYPDLSDAGLKDHMLWGALLLVTFFFGPGKWSLDHLLGRRFDVQ